MKKQLCLLSLAFVGLFSQANAQCNWKSLGPNDTDQIAFGQTEYNSLAFDPTNGNAYVGFWDENNYCGSVREFNGTQWIQVGPVSICPKKTTYTSVAVDNHSTPYFSCVNPNATSACWVWQYNKTTQMWDTLEPSSMKSSASYISLKIGKNSTPYVAFEDLGHGDKLDVMMWTGKTWTPLGGSIGISKGQAQWVSMAIDTINDITYVAYEDGFNYPTHHQRLMVMEYAAGAWSVVGGNADTAGVGVDTVAWTSLTLDKNGNPYVAYEDFGNGKGVSVMMYNGTTWSAVGTPSATTGGPVTYTSIGVDTASNVYVAYQDGSSFGKGALSAVEYVAKTAAWNYAGGSYNYSQYFSQGKVQYLQLAMNPTTNMPEVVTQDNGVGDHAQLYAWNGKKLWYDVRGEGFSDQGTTSTLNGAADYISIAAQPGTSNIYASYSDGNNALKTTVMSYTSGTWSVVGTAGISSGPAKFTNMNFDSKGDPICVFSDDYATPKYALSAMMYSGGSWSAIGSNAGTLSGTYAYYISSIVANDTIYAAFELSQNYALCVMKSPVNGGTGASWSYVGCTAAGITDTAAYESIAIDKKGMLYVAFQDNAADSNGITVMNYVPNKGWTVVGRRDICGGEAVYASLQIDPRDNMPVVAYSQYAGSFNAHCQKFDGTNWNYIGSSAGFSEDWTNEMTLGIDPSGSYFVAYQDWGNEVVNYGQRNITVQKFDPTVDVAWNEVPNQVSCSMAGSSSQAMAFDNGGNLYVGYNSVSGYVKELVCPTGINSINGSNNTTAKVYPNPTNGLFTVSLQNADEKTYITVYNVLGENVYSSKLTTDNTQVNIGSQPTGIYLYRICTESGNVISTGKLIVK